MFILHIVVFVGEIICTAFLREQVTWVLLQEILNFVNCCFRSFCLYFLSFHFMDGAKFFKMVANSCKHHMLVSYRRTASRIC